jgi:hypothetical protein
MGNLKFKVNDRVRVKSLEWYNDNKNESGNIKGGIPFIKEMTIYCSQVLTISEISGNGYHTRETGCQIYWNDDMYEGLVESELNEPQDNEQSFKAVDDVDYVKPVVFENIVFPNENYADKVELCLGDDYEIVVEDGRTFVQRKKPKYPKSFQECYYLLYGQQDLTFGRDIMKGAYGNLLECLQMLLICREVYWRIAGEQMGLGESWKPVYKSLTNNEYFTIHTFNNEIVKSGTSHRNAILAFPTEEMRDAFFENFKDLIESCKELL